MGVASASDASMLTSTDVSSIDGQESPHHLAEKEAAAQAKRDDDKDKDKNELMLDQAAPADDDKDKDKNEPMLDQATGAAPADGDMDKDKDEPTLDQAVLPAEACFIFSLLNRFQSHISGHWSCARRR